MAEFRKKPVVIEAIEWTGKNQQEIHDFTNRTCVFRGDTRIGWDLYIKTLEGEMAADLGDWIIKGVKGEFYPCKPDIFVMTYEEITSG